MKGRNLKRRHRGAGVVLPAFVVITLLLFHGWAPAAADRLAAATFALG